MAVKYLDENDRPPRMASKRRWLSNVSLPAVFVPGPRQIIGKVEVVYGDDRIRAAMRDARKVGRS